MNRIILIGNGFDLAHGLPTRYEDFINWYWDRRVKSFCGNNTNLSEDCLCTIKITSINPLNLWSVFAFNNHSFSHKTKGIEVMQLLKRDSELYEFTWSPFFKDICDSIETKRWVDIESEYYRHVKLCLDKSNTSNNLSIRQLNHQLEYLRILLAEYLNSLRYCNQENEDISNIIYGNFNPEDICVSKQNEYNKHCENYGTLIPKGKDIDVKFDNKRFSNPCKVLLLNFNYTTIGFAYLLAQIGFNYRRDIKTTMIFIHGNIIKPETIILGYGDELDDSYKSILKNEDNEYLKFIKSIRYHETDNYRKLLEFIDSDSYQIYIMGHSCGNSDRTLLNTLFEHKNCVSIKPYYYQKDDGSDNYMEIVQNICRNFTDMKLMRDRVVNKTFCEPLPQTKGSTKR